METKPLLYGLIGFFLGGLIVSVAATTFDKPTPERASDMPMSQAADVAKDIKQEALASDEAMKR